MKASSPLAGLRDIHLPEPIGWWPPAPGWWLLAAGLLLIAGLIFWLIRQRKKTVIKRAALAEFEQIRNQSQQTGNNLQTVKDLSSLLRRVCISIAPAQQSAALTGEAWLQHLDRLDGGNRFNSDLGKLLIEAPYRPQTEIEITALLDLCHSWLKKLPRVKKC